VTTATKTPGIANQPAETQPDSDGRTVRLIPPGHHQSADQEHAALTSAPAVLTRPRSGGEDHSPAGPARNPAMRSWPLLILALPATVAVWSGWVGIGQLTGFGQVRPLPGIWDSLHLNTAVTLPVGVEAYAAYALRAWLTTSTAVSARTRRFARRSATGSLLLGMAGQAGYHLLTQAHITRAPWTVTTAVSCLPVLVLGMGTALAHLLHADAQHACLAGHATGPSPDRASDQADHRGIDPGQTAGTVLGGWPANAATAAARLTAAGQPVSRRTLRASGLRGSNAALGTLARKLNGPAGAPNTHQHDKQAEQPRPGTVDHRGRRPRRAPAASAGTHTSTPRAPSRG
jgi:hypothetical protein